MILFYIDIVCFCKSVNLHNVCCILNYFIAHKHCNYFHNCKQIKSSIPIAILTFYEKSGKGLPAFYGKSYAGFSVNPAQASGPYSCVQLYRYRQALIKTISRGFDRVDNIAE